MWKPIVRANVLSLLGHPDVRQASLPGVEREIQFLGLLLHTSSAPLQGETGAWTQPRSRIALHGWT